MWAGSWLRYLNYDADDYFYRKRPKKFVVQGNVIGLEVISVKNLRNFPTLQNQDLIFDFYTY